MAHDLEQARNYVQSRIPTARQGEMAPYVWDEGTEEKPHAKVFLGADWVDAEKRLRDVDTAIEIFIDRKVAQCAPAPLCISETAVRQLRPLFVELYRLTEGKAQ